MLADELQIDLAAKLTLDFCRIAYPFIVHR